MEKADITERPPLEAPRKREENKIAGVLERKGAEQKPCSEIFESIRPLNAPSGTYDESGRQRDPVDEQALSSVSREIHRQSCLNQCRFVFFVVFTAVIVSAYFFLVLGMSRQQFAN